MVPLSKVKDLIAKHSKWEKELSSQDIDKKLFAAHFARNGSPGSKTVSAMSFFFAPI